MYFDSDLTGICSYGSNWQKVAIGPGNALLTNRQQAITSTKADLVHWCMYSALGEDELRDTSWPVKVKYVFAFVRSVFDMTFTFSHFCEVCDIMIYWTVS